ncbi:DUF4139 domain-containing protein [Yinghuangia sp. ASG 101]|uniref:DUF4139 domain-containing protein n=1 Tax=Yinghuangia sp. ASG 101 TaxID=2896848 RepID=UPI001E598515|nr:DUF4139 domain-containing protein [Yinghuangia sp. ASG 101]UGQ14732.1 DUF4139 domain-containing protein [Yinghuangia sp. ASG 101]
MAVAVEPDGAARTLGSVLHTVVVYARGAVCTRRATLALPAGHRGELRVRIGDVPLSAYVRSLRGSVVTGPEGLRVADVRPQLEAAVVEPEGGPELLRAVRDADAAVNRLRVRRQRLSLQIDTTAKLRAVPAKPRRDDPYPRPAAVEPVLALADFIAERLVVLHTRLRALDDEIDLAVHDAEVARNRLNEASSSLQPKETPTTGVAVLTLDLPGGAPAEPTHVVLDLDYQVPSARWVPQYQLRLDGAMAGGTLVMRAAVAQRTGEDWAGVRLGLSTADLERRTDLPELRSLRIGRRQSAPSASGWREPPSGLAELFGDYDAGVVKRDDLRRRVRAAVPPPPAAMVAAEAVFEEDATPVDVDWMGDEQYRGGPELRMPVPPAPLVAGSAPPAGPSAPSGAAAPLPRMARARSRPGGRRSADGAGYGGAPTPQATPAPVSAGGAPEPEQPSLGDQLLDYAGLVLDGPEVAASRGRLRAGGGESPLAQTYRQRAEEVGRLPLPAHAAHVRESAGSYDYRFDVAAPADVEADGGWHTVPVCSVDVGLEPEFVCVPSVDEAVFGTVHVTNASPYALLAGPADVSVGGEFVMTVPLPTLAPGQRQRVGVGVVESVQVARRTHMRESTAGLRGQTTVLDHRVEIDVANHLGREIAVEVRERIPVSDEKDVRIDEHKADPAWETDEAPRDGRVVRGARVWRLRLPANSTRTLVGRYEIRIPGGKAVIGGNRRA